MAKKVGGEQMFDYRVRESLSQDDLATILGVCQQTIHKFEAQKIVPSLKMAVKIAKVTGIPVDAWVKK